MQPTPEPSTRRRRQSLQEEDLQQDNSKQPENKLRPGQHSRPLPDGGQMIITDNFIR